MYYEQSVPLSGIIVFHFYRPLKYGTSEDTLRIRGAMPVRDGFACMDDTGRMVNRKTKTDKTNSDTNPIPDSGGAVLTLTKTIN